MGFLSDLFLGKRPDQALPGYATDFMDELRNSMPGIGFAGKQGKRLYKQYLEDPESLATQSLNQGAVERQTAGEDYASGANALLANSGSGNSGQQALQQRMKEMQINRINQNQGIAAQQEAQAKGFGGLGLYQDARNSQQNNITARYGIMGNAMNQNAYDRNRQGGLLSGIMSGFGSGLGAGFACWVAESLYGVNAFETMLLRHWINNVWTSRGGCLFLRLYLRFGKQIAEKVKRGGLPRLCAKAVFDRLLVKAMSMNRPPN